MSARRWAGDLAMGTRFAFTGGREGWVRALLTGVGVGLGVALLLLTAAMPSILDTRHAHEAARQDYSFSSTDIKPADDTIVVAHTDTVWHSKDVRGRLLQPEGAKAPLPPGIDRLPAAGEMYVSPALADLLRSPGTALLRERLPGKVVGTIGESGLIGSRELAYYAGSEKLVPLLGKGNVERIDRFGDTTSQGSEPLDPVLLLLVLMVFVVLLTPVAIFVATAVRFGGEQRDRRLAALRLIGCDGGTARRIAAGEALAGSVLGLVFGVGFFLAGAQLASSIELFDVSIFPDYLTPSPVLALLVALAVPATAVLVTLFSLRRVVIEPLGVVRTSGPGRRRLWWRLLLPLLGLLMLTPMIGKGNGGGDFNPYLVTFGVLALLVGITALLPWLVERAVGRLDGGPVSWQLAVRRLQLSSGTAARMVNGIAVAVAGAIALQMLFAGVDADYTKSTGKDPSRTQLEVDLRAATTPDATVRALRATRGVRRTVTLSETSFGARPETTEDTIQIMVGDCAALRELARISSCHEGDAFVSSGAFTDAASRKLMTPGHTVWVDPSYPGNTKGAEARWTLPAELGRAQVRKDALRGDLTGLLVTPSALPAKARPSLGSSVYVMLDPKVPEPEATEEIRTTVQAVDVLADVSIWQSTERSTRYGAIRTGLFAGAAAVLALIGASLLVSQLEQLRERKKLLSSLIAFGTRRRTLTLSVLWQTAIPIALGLLLAMTVGLTLGGVLMKMTAVPLRVDWPSVLSMTGVGAAIVLAVTLLSLPALLRLMRPDGLRTE
ncbi:FtsX-like permease family protein [Streptomyces fuscichromogenes]|uniref:Membrane protein n=1 Tax=Streptomyces fuscichromogenes TaxID=1324013 RepID=A0A918CVD7_9ACTN|nr:FtsX-like permease family protein [Streptomyces fuscichromogenes]GGN33407.1 membrane protein [Streptomyces fuscichromogenes]